MSTTIKSALQPEGFHATIYRKSHGNIGIRVCAFGEAQPPITLNPADLLSALRDEDFLPEDDGLRGRVEALAEDWATEGALSSYGAAEALREALNPTPPYQFPTGLGAVMEGKNGTVTTQLARIGDIWHDKYDNVWQTSEVPLAFTNLRTLSEGVEL
ncbi:hypothetical protein [Arthrobacter sp. NA-172]|uniref:hypothetical protein n=1 Tax=Arthrobacter sp. NA-172 TaxID=3367524 RepID=UPI00375423EA